MKETIDQFLTNPTAYDLSYIYDTLGKVGYGEFCMLFSLMERHQLTIEQARLRNAELLQGERCESMTHDMVQDIILQVTLAHTSPDSYQTDYQGQLIVYTGVYRWADGSYHSQEQPLPTTIPCPTGA